MEKQTKVWRQVLFIQLLLLTAVAITVHIFWGRWAFWILTLLFLISVLLTQKVRPWTFAPHTRRLRTKHRLKLEVHVVADPGVLVLVYPGYRHTKLYVSQSVLDKLTSREQELLLEASERWWSEMQTLPFVFVASVHRWLIAMENAAFPFLRFRWLTPWIQLLPWFTGQARRRDRVDGTFAQMTALDREAYAQVIWKLSALARSRPTQPPRGTEHYCLFPATIRSPQEGEALRLQKLIGTQYP